ncbi:MAG: PAS domain S-box protein [Bacteroidales bacterium]|nr:MAG: PAS domain S-box protein [Bacteroidales bacterium]
MKSSDYKLLIVYDNKSTNDYLSKKLSSLGYNVSGYVYEDKHALKLAKENKPDLLLVDISSPGNTKGLETVRTIISTLNLPAIFLTAGAEDKIIKEIGLNDLHSVIKKPVSEKDLEVNILTAVNKQKYFKELKLKEQKLQNLNKKLTKEVKSRDFYEKQILRSKKIYYSSFNALKESIFVIDRDLNIILENKALKDFNQRVGITEPSLGNSVEIYSNKLEGFGLGDYILVLRTGEEIYYDEVKLNENTIVEIRKSPVLDDNEIVSRVITSIKDITGNKHTEHKLIKSEKKVRDLMELLPEMIFETDLKGNVVYVNQFAIDRLDYTHEDISELNLFDIFAPGERERSKEYFEKRLANKVSGPKECYIVTQDNERFPVILHINPIIEKEKATGVRGVMIDITNRKKAEEQLKQSLQTTETIIGFI